MKKQISYLLILLLLCSLFITACAGSSGTEQDQSGETAALEPQDEGIDEDAEPQQDTLRSKRRDSAQSAIPLMVKEMPLFRSL